MVVNFAKVNGLKVTGTHPNRMLLDVSGKAADIRKGVRRHFATFIIIRLRIATFLRRTRSLPFRRDCPFWTSAA